jgi:large subunit ribosomal protein L7/L12
MATKKEDIITAIEEMSVLDLAELVKALEEKLGVSAAAPVAVAAAPGGAPAAAAEGSSDGGDDAEVTIILKEIGPNRSWPERGKRFSRVST